ncbi:Serine/threonine protein kinase [Nonomuraea maritima]|uniref:non-specific serine/threonine protein kinase n=1 Tax=Nonomuraea maritima TaxID=683260 RepID=A0A1G9REQ0_9ACTN|nr:serine/threonine-protein kinase [Nonomuraea maritima]SDM21651.1 Serine/threonine protein kinase [Nonomuraea maritima]
MVSDSNRLIAGRYQLLRELGRGGMGVVWEGQDTLLNRQVAVKEVLLPEGLSPGEQERHLLRTVREARIAAKLNHPSVVAIYDVAEDEGRPWIVMELLRFPSVEQVVQSSGALPVREAAEVGRQVLSALKAAHAAGILHRDVKPSNILLAEDGRAVLTDFGIATAEGDSSLTKTGMVTGSPSFLAPERVRADDAGPPSDLWSLGATLYACMVGRSPFERGDPMSTINALLNEEPDYRRIPPIMHPVLRGLMRKEPAERLDAEATDRELAAVVAARPAYVDLDVPERKKKKGAGSGRALLAAAATVVLVVAGGTLAYFRIAAPAEGAPRGTQAAAASSPLTPTATPPAVTATPTPSPTDTVATPRTRPAVPAVRVWRSGEGWSILRPTGWRGTRAEALTEWTRGDGHAHLGVETIYVNLDPNQIIRDSQETFRQKAERVVNHGRRTVTHQGATAVEWQFTWIAGAENNEPWVTPGTRYREVRRAVAIGDAAYVLSWTVPEMQWKRNRALMRQVFTSFTVRA